MSDGAIVVEHVTKSFARGRVEVLSDLSLRVEPGELVVLVGPSGSGKSTTLHLVAALDWPDSGTISVDGAPLRHIHADRHRRETVGLVFQLHNLLPHLSARQNLEAVMFGTHRGRRARHERADELLDKLGMRAHADSLPPELSGGERQRVAVARAFANAPATILADEPSGSLDDVSADLVLTMLRQHCDDGGSVLAVSHDPRMIPTADRVLLVEHGVARPAPR
jgi:putative ABC transport system ATP-binding protein